MSGGAKLNVSGTTTWSGSDITTGNGAQLNNSGTFTITGSGKIAHDPSLGGARGTFTNNGTLTKNTSGDAAEIETVFNNAGTVTVATGSLKLKGGGSSTSNVTVSAGASLVLSDNNYNFTGGNITGNGTIEVAGAVTTFNGTGAANANVKVSGGKAKFDTSLLTTGALTISSGTLESAAGTTTGVGAFNWTGGDINASKITAGGSGHIGAGAKKRLLAGAELTFGGNTTWDGSTIDVDDATTIHNRSGVTFSVTGDGTIAYAGTGTRAQFTNNGTFTQNAGNTAGTNIQARFNNTGQLNANGRLRLTGGGTSTGNVTVGADSTLAISDQDYAFNGGTLGGTGTIELQSATTTLNGTNGSANLHVKSGAGLRLGGNHTSTGNLTLNAGTIDGAGVASVAGFDFNGGLINAATITASGTVTIAGGSTKQLQNGAQLNLTGNTTWDASTTAGATNDINTSGAGTKIKNTGTFTIKTNARLENDSTTADRATFRNEGTFTQAPEATGETKIRTKFENASGAAVNVNGGTLDLDGGLANSGNVTLADGTRLLLRNSGVDYKFDGGALNGNGTGSIRIQGSTAEFSGTSGNATIEVLGGTTKFSGTHHGSGKLALSSGRIEGTGNVTVGAFEWESGNITGANLTVSGASITGNGTKSVGAGGQLNLSGSSSWSPTVGGTANDITTGGANTRIRNTGHLTTNTDGAIGHDGTSDGRATFRNEGTFTKVNTTSGGATRIETRFENAPSATVDLQGGSLKLLGGGSGSGTFNVHGGANIVLADSDFTFSGATLGGSGSLDVESFTTTFTGTTGSANVTVKGGSARFTGAHSGTGSLRLQSGKIEGNSTASFGNLDWTGGNITGASITANGTVISGTQPKKISDGAQLNLSGATSWTADNILTGGSATTIKNTGTFSISNDGTIGNDDAPANRATFRNEGTFTKTNTTSGGTTEVQSKFDNAAGGAVNIDGGKLKLTGGGNSSGNLNIAAGAFIEVAGSNYAFTGGALNGDGIIDVTSATASLSGTTGNAHVKVTGNGQLKFDGTHNGTGNLTLDGGSIAGAGQGTVGQLQWTSGTVDSKLTASGATLGSSGSKTLGSSADLTLLGQSTWDGTTIHANGNGKIRNSAGATFTVSADGEIVNGGSAIFTNNGTFEKTAGSAGAATNLAVRFESDGEIKANAGTLKFSGGGKSSNNIVLGTGATVEISGANFDITGGAINGAGGKLHLADKVTTFTNSTSSSAEISVNGLGATAKFDGTHQGSGKLSLASGTVSGTGTAEFGSLAFSGGTISGRVKSNGAATLGGDTKTVTGELTLAGETTWDSSALHTAGSGKIKNNAAFIARGDGAISNGGTGTFENSGTFEKASGNGGSTDIHTRFENTGEIKVSAGQLKLLGGGNSSASVTLADNASLDIAGADFAITGGAINGAKGKLNLADKTTTFTNATSGSAELSLASATATAKFDGTHTGSGKLSLSAGTVAGTGSAEFGALDWSGGTLRGKLKTNGNANLRGTGTMVLSTGADLLLAGTTVWSSGTLHSGNGAKITNDSAATFSATFDGNLAYNQGGNRATFENKGTFKKENSAGTTNLDAVFTNTGTLDATTGTLALIGGGSSTGANNTVTIGNGAKVKIDHHDFTFDGTTFSGAGTVEIGNATTKFKGAHGNARVDLRDGTADFDSATSTLSSLTLSSGTVASSNGGSATIGSLDWSGGTLRGKLKSNGNANLGGTGTMILSTGADLLLAGTTVWSSGTLHSGNGAKITNDAAATFSATFDGNLAYNQGGNRATFENKGTFKKENSAGTTNLDAVFSNTGSVHATTGTLALLGGGSSSGANNKVDVATGAKLKIDHHDFTFDGTAFSGAGTVEIGNATTKFKGATGNGRVDVKGGTADFDSAASTLSSLALSSGTLASTNGGSATIGTLDWSGGTLRGKLKTNGNANLRGTGTMVLSTGADLLLAGTTVWSSGTLHSGNGAKITNDSAATFSATFDGNLAYNQGGNRAAFENKGTFKKDNSAGTTNLDAVFTNTGTLDATTGTLALIGGGSSTGANNTVTIGNGAKVKIDHHAFTFDGTTFSGAGTVEIGNATTKFKAATGNGRVDLKGGNIDFDSAASTLSSLALSSGTLASTNGGSATIGTLDWSGGTLRGKVKSNGNANLGGTGTMILSTGADLLLAGTTTWSSGTLHSGNGAKITNDAAATFNATFDGDLAHNQGGNRATFENKGTFKKLNSNGTTTLDAVFTNTGATLVDSGTLWLVGGGSSSGVGNAVTIGNAAKIKIDHANYTFENTTFAGDGTLELTSATTRFKGTAGSGKIHLNGGRAELDTSILSAALLTLADGSLDGINGGSASVTALDWTGGTLNAKLRANGTTIGGGNAKHLSTAAELLLNGTTTWTGAQITAAGNGRIHNQSGGNFLVTADGVLANTGSAIFTNDGTFTKSHGGGSSTQLEVRFDNNGIVKVDAGKLRLSGGGKNAANASILVGATAELLIDGNLELAANSTLSGDGLGRLVRGTLTAHGDVHLKGFSFEPGDSSHRVLAGTNTFHGAVDWHGGKWDADASVTTTIALGGTLNLRSNSSHEHANRSIVNYGTVNWHSGNIRGGNGSSFTNHNLFKDLNAGTKSLSSSTGTASFTNRGEYRKTEGGTTNVDIPFTNYGIIKVSSGLLVFNNTFTNQGELNLTNGASAQFSTALKFDSSKALTGVGTIDAPAVEAAGQVAPGVSPGALNITGSLTLLNTSQLLIELGGPGQGTGFDFLSVGGRGVLDGELRVSFLNGYQWHLPAGATFTILTAGGGLTGEFANAPRSNPLFNVSTFDNAATFNVSYGVNSVVLSNFVVAVPEPSTYAMMALGSLILLFNFRRRKK